MNVKKVLRMNGGSCENSYWNNSTLQRVVMSKAKLLVEEAIWDLLSCISTKSLCVGDLGCSCGPNAFALILEIVDAVDRRSRQLNRPAPELRVILNDLPGNDFNTLFQSLPVFYDELRREKEERFGPCFISVVPGSFYGRLFPSNSMHFAHSSYSLHWLSQVPLELRGEKAAVLNKGNIYLAESSSPLAFKAYLEHFQRDFSLFLQSRSEELVPGGKMVLTLVGRRSGKPSGKEGCFNLWKLLAEALHSLVPEGLIEEAKMDTFSLPYYTPSMEELRAVVEEEGSFELNKLDKMEVSWDGNEEEYDEVSSFDEVRSGRNVAKMMRAVAEPMLVDHFEAGIMDEVFNRYAQLVAKHLSKEKTKHVNLIGILTRRFM